VFTASSASSLVSCKNLLASSVMRSERFMGVVAATGVIIVCIGSWG
jgi:hypothetical protein